MIPLTVPQKMHKFFRHNYDTITKKTNRLFLFAGDQKMEHLNADFYGQNIPDVCNNPQHLFTIASKAPIGCFATHLGLLARHGHQHANVPYIIKLNGKTNLYDGEPHSHSLHSVADVVDFAHASQLPIAGIGYTVYVGSAHEGAMLRQAAQHVLHAHQNGLVAVLWIYPRGKSVKDPHHGNMLAGAAGVAASLGADFVKVALGSSDNPGEQSQALRQAVGAAGATGVVCAGGSATDSENFLTHVHAQLSIAGTRGIAVGRNIYQNSVDDAVELCKKLSTLVYGKTS